MQALLCHTLSDVLLQQVTVLALPEDGDYTRIIQTP